MDKAIKPKDIKQALEGENIVIDLRSKGYFLLDHIKDAINISPEDLKKISHIASEHADKKIILYCYHGITAQDVVESLKENDNIYFIRGSFADIVKSGVEIFYANR